MKIIYRISDSGYNKIKPDYIDNEKCLQNFCNVFYDYIYDIHIIADNCSETTMDMINKYIDPVNIEKVSVGHGAGTFNLPRLWEHHLHTFTKKTFAFISQSSIYKSATNSKTSSSGNQKTF